MFLCFKIRVIDANENPIDKAHFHTKIIKKKPNPNQPLKSSVIIECVFSN